MTDLDLKKGGFLLTAGFSVASFLLAGFNETLVVIWLYLIFLVVILIRYFKGKLLLPGTLIEFVIFSTYPLGDWRRASTPGDEHFVLYLCVVRVMDVLSVDLVPA